MIHNESDFNFILDIFTIVNCVDIFSSQEYDTFLSIFNLHLKINQIADADYRSV